MDPAFPWIHIPRETFTEFVNLFKERAKDQGLECDDYYGECRFRKPCSMVNNPWKPFDFSFETHINGKLIKVPSEKMLIPGSKLEDRRNDLVCFLAVFRNTHDDNWVLGTNVMA